VTPYAVLLVKPTDDDDMIRKRFHELARSQHPDRDGAAGVPGPLWQTLIDAYGQVKTAQLRAAWHQAQVHLARLCLTCEGLGVTWRRVGKDRAATICGKCNGEGRVKK
jgi:DnaJ-class molecular chaperone